ncbi:MAG: hypothetical protein AAF799_00610 [Myxococcota bacterium]
MPLYAVAIALTIVANIGYHLCQKGIRPEASPIATVMATYMVALALSALMWPWLGHSDGLVASFRRLGPASYALGGCVVLLEIGFLLAYRSGWDLGVAALYSNAATAIVLLPIGLLAFSEGIDGRKALGLVFAFVGLVLLSGGGGEKPKDSDAPAAESSS